MFWLKEVMNVITGKGKKGYGDIAPSLSFDSKDMESGWLSEIDPKVLRYPCLRHHDVYEER